MIQKKETILKSEKVVRNEFPLGEGG